MQRVNIQLGTCFDSKISNNCEKKTFHRNKIMVKSTISPEEFVSTARWLRDPQKSMAIRFRALFTLKNIGGQSTIDHIGKVLFEDDSALLKHECAYCLGQMQDVYAIEILSKVLANTMEHPMVRHEAGEALGAIGTDECLKILQVIENCFFSKKVFNFTSI